jgi:hypothetical protein
LGFGAVSLGDGRLTFQDSVAGSYSLFAYRTNLEYEITTLSRNVGKCPVTWRSSQKSDGTEYITWAYVSTSSKNVALNLPYSPVPFSCWPLHPLALRSEASVYKFYNQCTKNGTTHVNKSSFFAVFSPMLNRLLKFITSMSVNACTLNNSSNPPCFQARGFLVKVYLLVQTVCWNKV